MITRPLLAVVAKDLQVFFSDRHSVVLAFVAPIVLASLMATVFGGAGTSKPSRIEICLVDEDESVISRAIVDAASAESRLRVRLEPREAALARVRLGESTTTVIIPEGFGERAADALLGDDDPPELPFHFDPTHQAEVRMVQGLLTRLILESVAADSLGGVGDLLGEFETDAPRSGSATVAGGARAADPARDEFLALVGFDDAIEEQDDADARADRAEFTRVFPGLADLLDSPESPATLPDLGPNPPRELGSSAARAAPKPRAKSRGVSMPYAPRDVSILVGGTAGEHQALAAHAFAGMIVQFVLFSAVEWGVNLLIERRRGIWKRMRLAPVSRFTMLGGKVVGSMMISCLIITGVFGAGALIFGYRVNGSFAALVALALAFSWTAANLGLLVAALGRSPQGARSVSVLCVLLMVMLGGGWIPSFLFPEWLQTVNPAIPTRWAVDGFDGVFSRGFSFGEARPALLALFGFGAAFAGATALTFRWEEPS
ncbi:MAG: ABC transporter permease [Isosphaeraceae bacterium]|nr:ABC transporter permease [Isosphaeraceae bacterium]